MRKSHSLFKKGLTIFFQKENKLFFFTLVVALSLLSGFLPVYETPLSQTMRQHLYTIAQPVLKSSAQGNQRENNSFMVKQLAIEEKKVLLVSPKPLSIKQVTPEQWGKATQLDEHTWTMKITADSTMASAREILDALNSYRQKKGKATVSWDETLARYAQERATFFNASQKLDGHAGFQSYVADDGFTKLGFSSLGENSSFGYKLIGVHLIEWIYAGDAPHDNNQLNAEWTHVGVGVNETSTDLIFGGQKR